MEARWWRRGEDGVALCRLCPHACRIAPGHAGICGVRENHDGTLVAASYGICTSIAVDPIEKKPLYHFLPGSDILSVGAYGCNFRCPFCQNYEISQGEGQNRGQPPISVAAVPGRIAARARNRWLSPVLPEDLVALARQQRGNRGISYTYNEPLIGLEYVQDCAKLAHEHGLANVLVSNGFVNREPFEEVAPLIDAINIDIKSIDPGFYTRLCHGKLDPVLATAQVAKRYMHVEVTNLIITDENDSIDGLRALAQWVGENLGRDTPLHFSRYRPAYRMTNPPTPEATLKEAWEVAREYVDHVYLGNVLIPGTSDTHCAGCGATLVSRSGFATRMQALGSDATCTKCGAQAPFVMAGPPPVGG